MKIMKMRKTYMQTNKTVYSDQCENQLEIN